MIQRCVLYIAGLMLVLSGWPSAALAQLSIMRSFAVERAPHAEPYAIRFSEADQTVRFELRPGDCAKQRDCATERERVEIKEVERDPLHQLVWYRFALYLPADYPEMSPKQILGQWHDGRRPALSNRYENGTLWLDLMAGASKTTHKFPVKGFAKGAWHELVYAIRWSPNEDGAIRAWNNGGLVTDYQGPTLSADWSKRPRFKIGIYRSHLDRFSGTPPTQVAYVRGYSRAAAIQ